MIYAVTVSGELQEAVFDINLTDAEAWLTADRYEQGHSMMTDQEIVNVVNKPIPENFDEDYDLVDEPVVPSHSEVFACFTKCIIWTEAQTDIDPVSVQLLRRL